MSTSLRYYLCALTAIFLALASASCSDSNQTRYAFVLLSGEDMWSIVDVSSGEIFCKTKFTQRPSHIVNDRFCVQNENGLFDYYSISDIGHPLNSESYLHATQFSESGRAMVVKPGEGISIIDGNCNIIATLDNDIFIATCFHNGYSIIMDKNDKFGYIDESGNIVIQPQYDNANHFSANGVAIVSTTPGFGYTYYAIDTDNKTLFSFPSSEYYPSDCFFNDYLAVLHNSTAFLLDKSGERVLPLGKTFALNSSVGPVHNTVAFCKNGLWGLKNLQSEIIASAEYRIITPCSETSPCFLAKKQDKCGVIDYKNNVIVPFDYDALISINDSVLVGLSNDVFILIDMDGNRIGNDSFVDMTLYNPAFESVKSDR